MLKRWHKAALVLVGIAILVFVGSFFFPAENQVCEYNKYAHTEECAFHHFGPFAVLYIAQTLKAYSDLITGLATALLVVITYLLVRLGREQSKTTRAQLRAYISVIIGDAYYQAGEVSFEGKPTIVNNGQTPAYNVSYSARAEILSASVASSYTFTAPQTPAKSQSSIGPKEFRGASAILPYKVPETEIDEIKFGVQKALWVWGVVHYDDVFGDPHFTQFCQRFLWLPDGKIYGFYDGRFGLSD